jgi:uncharacterized membrane protein
MKKKKHPKKKTKKKKKNHDQGQELTTGQRLADKITGFGGSWTFIISLFVFLTLWMIANVILILFVWDPYPFILLNLVLSCLAAIQAPIILMSQNRQMERDRIKADRDYGINRKAEREIAHLQKQLKSMRRLVREDLNNHK